MTPHLSGIILVGGRSRRLGRDKATLAIDGVPSVVRIARALRPLVLDLCLVGGPHRPDLPDVADLPWIPDRIAGAGPLGGIISGLLSTDADWSFVLACDTPLVTTEVLQRLADAIPAAPGVIAVVPRTARGPEPLVALYARTAAAPLSVACEAGERALHRILGRLPVRFVDEDVLRDVDPDLDAFLNVNTEADLQRLVAKLTPGRGNDTL